ncbi:MAG: MoxR family ATPase [Saprospiraceae bacterium]|nr:MoxR family ATPase [Saprospiraceae bacterium]
MELHNNPIDLDFVKLKTEALFNEVSKFIVGQHTMVRYLTNGLLCNGHILLEGNPGLAKTTTARCIAKTLACGFSRIQFTPDLMPADILGTSIFNPQNQQFEFRRGPIFSNFILIDEINRAPARTQSALFEVMEERQVSVDGTQYLLTFPFLVIATQNPIEMEGTYRLPEAQLDRFQLKIDIPYPSHEEETQLLMQFREGKDLSDIDQVQAVWDIQDLKKLQSWVNQVTVDDKLIHYITAIVQNSRKSKDFMLGASPRAAIYLLKSARAHALLDGRDFVIPEDIVEVSLPVLSHRLILSAERELDSAGMPNLVKKLVKSVEVPR